MLFSIITVCFNDRAGLRRTRESIIQQTCRDFEWIVVDGGSKDGAAEDIAAWQSEITWSCSEADKGIYDAMNKGIDRAQGHYLVFMNAGDAFADDHVLEAIRVALLLSPDAEFLYGDSYETLPNGKMVLKRARPHSKWWWGMWTHHQAMVYSRAAIGVLRYDLVHVTNADYKLSMQVIKKAKQIVKLDFAVAHCDIPGFSARRPAFARKMQRKARRDVMEMNFLPNYAVSAGQALSIFIRRNFPQLFAILRFS